MQVFFVRAVRIFIMVARCSKCDFRNLGIIWDRNRWPENVLSEKFSSKKIVGNFEILKNFRICFRKCFESSMTFSTKKHRQFWFQKVSGKNGSIMFQIFFVKYFWFTFRTQISKNNLENHLDNEGQSCSISVSKVNIYTG